MKDSSVPPGWTNQLLSVEKEVVLQSCLSLALYIQLGNAVQVVFRPVTLRQQLPIPVALKTGHWLRPLSIQRSHSYSDWV